MQPLEQPLWTFADMNKFVRKLQEGMKPFDYNFKTVSIEHLQEVQDSVGRLVRLGLIDTRLHQQWRFYLSTNNNLPEAKSIIIIAIPQLITRLHFRWQGIDYPAEIAPNYIVEADEYHTEEILNGVLQPAGYKTAKARLALKTLAVRSGLATYGKNNISYVSGMGSFFRLTAFFTDLPAEDNWQDPKVMGKCADCLLCQKNCPTGSIPTDRFLIRAERCLGFLNEMDSEFPYWVQLQPDWQNAFIGCMRCQFVCPVNKTCMQKALEGPVLSEEETEQMLNRTPWENLSSETQQKLGISEGIYSLLGRNLNALIEKQKKRAHH